MAQTVVKVLGWVFLVIGILGFVPGITADGDMLRGVFEVNAAHNIVHVLTGILALVFARSASQARTFAMVFGIIYAIIALLGFFTGDVLGFVVANGADNWLHVLLAIIFLWAGFAGRKSTAAV